MNQISGDGRDTSRRALLRAMGAAGVATGLAGCNDVTNYSFSATPVVLEEAARTDLGAAVRSSRTLEETVPRSIGGVEAEVTLVSEFAAYETAETVTFGDGASGPVDTRTVMGTRHVLGVLATPRAAVGGQERNPIARDPLADVVTGERGRDLLARLGVDPDAEIDGGLEPAGAVSPSDLAGAVSPSDLAGAVSPSDVAGAVTPSSIVRFVGRLVEPAGDRHLLVASVGRSETGDDAVILAGVQQFPLARSVAAPASDLVGADALDASTAGLVAFAPFFVPDGTTPPFDPAAHSLGAGEYVSDHEDRHPEPAVTVLAADIPIESWAVFSGETVADHNPQYDPAEPVVMVVYEHLLDAGWPDWRTAGDDALFDGVVEQGVKFHAFPRSRLRRHLLAPGRT